MARSPRRSYSPERDSHRRSSHRRDREHNDDDHRSGDRYERSSHAAHASSSRRPDDRRSGRNEIEYDDRDRERDRERRRDRDRDSGRDRDVRRDDTRDYGRRDERARDRERERDRDRDREPRRRNETDDHRTPPRSQAQPRPPPRSGSTASPGPPTTSASASGPVTEEEKQRLKREKLEAWKRQREKQKQAEGKVSTPEPAAVAAAPAKKPAGVSASFSSVSAATPASSLPPKPTGFNFTGFAGMGLPMNAGSGSKLKRTVAALDHDDDGEPERKFEKLDLPEVDPTVQTGETGGEGDVIGADLAAEDVEVDEKPDVTANANGHDEDIKMDGPDGKPDVPEMAPKSEAAPAKQEKMEVAEEEEEEDPLDAYMKEIGQDVSEKNRNDAKRLGMMAADEEEEEKEVKNVAEQKLQEAEALLATAASRSRKKDLPPPDHSKINYEPFRKAFYSAPVEVMEMDEEETELLRLEMDGIKVRGQEVPRPVKNWGAFGLPAACLDMIQRKGWTAATSIQAQAIPCIMSGRDVIGIAKTGSGKTIAYLLPLFRHVKDQRPSAGNEGPIAMVMGPTRELAMQIYTEIKSFAKVLNFRVACCVGGASISEDISEMKKGADVVICTPGRMIDLLTANNGRVTNVRRVTYLVLDEADRMFDMGFEPQVMKIVTNIRPDAQKVLFSATFPKTMESLARRILQRPLEITVGGRSVVGPEIDQRVEIRDADTKFTRLLELLGEYHQANKGEEDEFRTLIFVERQEAADDLFRELLTRGYVCASLHGGKEQVDRDEAIKNFKTGDVPTIVATSVAARGLDVKELKLVINYDAPNHMEDYVHRAGRTGRAGNTGTCITFLTPEQEKLSVDIVRALEASKAFISDELKNMSDSFLGKIKSGKAKASSGGFKGKGLERFERKREEKDRAELATYGDTSEALSLSSREGAVIPYKPKTNEYKPPDTAQNRGEADYTFTEIKVEIVNGPAPDKASVPGLSAPQASGKATTAGLPQQTLDALKKARAEGRNVDAENLQKVIARLQQAIDLGMKKQSATQTAAATAAAAASREAAAAAANQTNKPKDPDATDYHAIFPINDYPQKARWKATNKEQMTMLAEISGASITMRGIYYPPGEDPPMGGEPKLHLLIESNDEMKVRAAVEEIRRNLVEASVQALNNADRGGAASGRYNV